MLSSPRKSKLILRSETVATLSSVSLDGVMGGAGEGAQVGGAIGVPKVAEAQVVPGRLSDLIAPRRFGSCFCPFPR